MPNSVPRAPINPADTKQTLVAQAGSSTAASTEWVLFRGLKSAKPSERDFAKTRALRMMMAWLNAAVSRLAIGHSDRVGCTSALEGITDPSQTSHEVQTCH
jgi:hypothetical protein